MNWNDYRTIAIFGNMGSGKTALAFRILEDMKKSEEHVQRQVYFVKHPKPELIESFGYKSLNSLDELARLTDAIVYWDEPQLGLEVAEYKRDLMVAKVLSLARQRNLTIIVSSSDTRTFGKRVEAYFDMWVVKDMEYDMTKQRSQIRQILKANAFICPEEIHLDKNEYLLYNRKDLGINGRHEFALIEAWSEALSTPYKTHQKLAENSSKTREKLTQKTDSKNCAKKLTEITAINPDKEEVSVSLSEVQLRNSQSNSGTEIAGIHTQHGNVGEEHK